MQKLELLSKEWLPLMSKAWKNGSTSRWRKIRERIIARDQCCQKCGQTEGRMHVDHIIPKRLNGSDDEWNLRLLCEFCNLQKGGRFFEAPTTPPTLHGAFIPQNVSLSHD
jgi:5-methylcytosine-specific restriction endonuclease McrA